MPRTTDTPTADERFVEMNNSVHRVASLIRRVLLKFPHNTLPPALKPLIWTPDWSFRLSNDGTEIVLTHCFSFRRTPEWVTARFPVALLAYQESDVTSWARERYWSGVKEVREQHRRAAHRRVSLARESVERARISLRDAERSLERASAETDAAYAPSKKQRRAQRLKTAPQ